MALPGILFQISFPNNLLINNSSLVFLCSFLSDLKWEINFRSAFPSKSRFPIAGLNRTGYCPGEVIKISATCENSTSNKILRSSADLLQVSCLSHYYSAVELIAFLVWKLGYLLSVIVSSWSLSLFEVFAFAVTWVYWSIDHSEVDYKGFLKFWVSPVPCFVLYQSG